MSWPNLLGVHFPDAVEAQAGRGEPGEGQGASRQDQNSRVSKCSKKMQSYSHE